MRASEWIDGERVKLIGEIGANHQGSLDHAERLLRLAASLGVDCVKGQMRDLDAYRNRTEAYTGPHSFGATYYEHRCALELPESAHAHLVRVAREVGVEYSVSVWQASVVDAAARLGASWLKIPSACLTDHALLRRAARTGLLLLVSTGMSTEAEVRAAAAVLASEGAGVSWIPLVCTSAYPCQPRDVHLRRVDAARALSMGGYVGVSGHWSGIHIDPAAVALDVSVIERHITTDPTLPGTDHAASLGPHGMALWVRAVRQAEDALGDVELGPLDCEMAARAKLRGGG